MTQRLMQPNFQNIAENDHQLAAHTPQLHEAFRTATQLHRAKGNQYNFTTVHVRWAPCHQSICVHRLRMEGQPPAVDILHE
jgi:hypothetical protein